MVQQSQFRLYNDPDSNKWNDFVNWGEFAIKGVPLIFRENGRVFTLKGDLLKKQCFVLNVTNSPDEKSTLS